ncbi:MAG TPA: ABC transporter ATP-binding protein [Acidimicrobiales bacterium]
MSVDATVVVELGPFRLDVAVRLRPGEVVAVLGPNGAGKTTLLRTLAGLLALDEGRIEIDGTTVDDPDAGVFVPAEQRSVGVVFQDYLLFPNLSALENVAFGLRARGVARATARARASEWLDRLGLDELADRRPQHLSGGQAQRVALGRALATEPTLVLLDEPLAALDVGSRAEVRRDLRRHLDRAHCATLVITHDPVDAHALADRVVVIESGQVRQEGVLTDIASHPRSRYVAELVGMNLITGTVREGVLEAADGSHLVVPADVLDGPAFAVVRPSAIALHRGRPEGSARNAWPLRITDLDRHGDRVRVRLDGPPELVAEVTTAGLADLDARPGDRVWASLKATDIDVQPDRVEAS